MPATLADLRQGLADRLATLDGIQASPYMLANPTPPTAHVLLSETLYDSAMHRGLDTWSFRVQLFVALGLDQAAQMQLDGYIAASGSGSVKAAIEADRTLGGKAQDTRVVSVSGYQLITLGENRQVLSVEFLVSVVA